MRGTFSLAAVLFVVSMLTTNARDPLPGADAWLTNAVLPPEQFATAAASTNRFATLHAEVLAGRLRITCTEPGISGMNLIASADAPGHWPARDWRSHTMRSNAAAWFVELPVDSLYVPIVYFVVARESNVVVASAMRMVQPLALGLEEPTRFFWPFIEGFELELEGWRLGDNAEVRTDPSAKNGRAALMARVPAGGRAATVTTTRLRGWFLEEHGARGVALWLRTKSGTGSAAFTLLANAFTANQVAARRVETVKVSSRWTKVELPFASFPKFPLGDLDLLSIELSGKPGTEFLLDDLYLLGPWLMDF